MDSSTEEIIKSYKEALEEIRDIAHISEGEAPAFYGMLADKALKKAEELMNGKGYPATKKRSYGTPSTS